MLRSEGDASLALDKQNLVQVTDQPMDSDYHAMMAFMNEDVEVEIHTTADENAEQVFELWVNGRCEFSAAASARRSSVTTPTGCCA